MSLISDFIRQYNKEYDYYQKLSITVANSIEEQIFKRGIKAIVSNRAKKAESLEEKLKKRNKHKPYSSFDEIYRDIVDLSGVRVSLYFPSDRNLIDEIVNELFIVEEKKDFPESAQQPKYNKRFSGYWATHYRIKLHSEDGLSRYTDSLTEIQVASVLMHAWSEVEHDLVYKPLSGELSEEELSILDEINGLVLSGEIALERLQKAIVNRTNSTNEITNKYDLTNYLSNNLKKTSNGKIKFGDTYALNTYLKTKKKINTVEFNKYIKNINTESNETVTDQLLNMLLIDGSDNKINIKDYYKNLKIPSKKVSSFELFIRCWSILEEAVKEVDDKINYFRDNKIGRIIDFDSLLRRGILSESELETLNNLRRTRNYIYHGSETPKEFYIENSFFILKELTRKIISHIIDKKLKKQLQEQLDSLD